MTIDIDCGICEQRLESWKEFVSLIQDAHANNDTLIYRGQADANWKIESAIDRLEARYPSKKNHSGRNPESFGCSPASRPQHLEAFKESVRGKRSLNSQELSENEWWALAQHHGLATPLLDWTYSPFVALFFAFEAEGYIDCRSREFRLPERRVVYVVPFHLIDGSQTKENSLPTVFSPRREITHRLSSQTGVLMNMARGTDLESIVRARYPDETSSANLHARQVLTKIVIPNAGRVECLKFLNKMNINRMSLYGDLDGAAQYINSLWELNFDTPLGSLSDGA